MASLGVELQPDYLPRLGHRAEWNLPLISFDKWVSHIRPPGAIVLCVGLARQRLVQHAHEPSAQQVPICLTGSALQNTIKHDSFVHLS